MDLLSIIVITLALTSPAAAQDIVPSGATVSESGVGVVAVEDPIDEPFDARALADRLVGDPDSSPALRSDVGGDASIGTTSPRPLRATLNPAAPPLNPPTTAAWWQQPELRVIGLLLVMGAAAWMLKRWKVGGAGGVPGRPAGVMSVLARYPFGRGGSLVLIECGPKIVLLHQHAGRGGDVTALSEFTDPQDLAALRTRLGAVERQADPAFVEDLQNQLGAYDRSGRPVPSGSTPGGLEGGMDMVDLTRRRPRRGIRNA